MNINDSPASSSDPENGLCLSTAQLMASRICHDIVNPLGAVANGLELLELSGFPRTEEFKLVQSSVEAANRRIKMLRLAFGLVHNEQEILFHEMKSHIDTIFDRPGFTINIQFQDNLKQSEAQIILLACLCIADCLPYGGNVSIVPKRLGFSSDRTVLLDLFNTHLKHRNETPPDQLHFAYLHTLSHENDRTIEIKTTRKDHTLYV